MANPDRQYAPEIKRTEQYVLNSSFDEVYKVLAVMGLEWDGGTKVSRQISSNTAVIIDSSADPIIYIGKAPIGSIASEAVWQISKLDTSSGLIKTWADGDADFNNIWDNRTSLTYS